MIDPHVHCRDDSQAYKETIKHVLELAKDQGVEKIFDMPNTDPPILWEKNVIKRLKLVPKDEKDRYFLYVGATRGEKQLEEAVNLWENYEEVVGIKLYAGETTGNLAITNEEDQREIYRILTELNYTGVLVAHCEKKKYLKTPLWNPKYPFSHSYARPPKAEIESVKDQIKFAEETGFNGNLHICHVSCPESVELVNEAKEKMKITCGITPHHILWDNEMLKRPDGLLYKMNPPLRNKEHVDKLKEYLKEDWIDWIETDHAPHAIGEKLHKNYPSGYPSLYLYKDFVENFLPNIGLSDSQIENLTYKNIVKTFKTA